MAVDSVAYSDATTVGMRAVDLAGQRAGLTAVKRAVWMAEM
jgi:hypothetical protein